MSLILSNCKYRYDESSNIKKRLYHVIGDFLIFKRSFLAFEECKTDECFYMFSINSRSGSFSKI